MEIIMNCSHHELKIVIDEGEYICTNCGTVLDRHIDEGPEWRYYGAEDRNEDMTRTGNVTNELLPESSYGSSAAHRRGTHADFRYLEKLSAWSLASHGERSWLGAFDLLQNLGTRYGLPKAILHDACAYFRRQEDALKLRGETRRALMGAAIFLACRKNGASRTHEEIAELFRVSTRSLCKGIQRYGMQKQEDNPILKTQLSLAERMMDLLKMEEKHRSAVLEKLRGVFHEEEELEHTPKVVVAGIIASLLLEKAEDKRARLKEISKTLGVSVVSIQKMLGKV
jgi:transcription initiation factor TFIIIB Brf1 subunit/transcription initiation factor TFIIB